MSFQVEDKTICRVCTQKQHDTSSIFKTKTFLKQPLVISEVMTSCATIQVHRNDGLPENICTHCLDDLHQAYSFKKLCEKSDCDLRRQLFGNQFCVKQEIKTEKEDEPEFVDTNNLLNVQTATNTKVNVEFELKEAEKTFNSQFKDERGVKKDDEDNNSDLSPDKVLLEAEKPNEETIDFTEHAITEEHIITTKNKKPTNSCEKCKKTFKKESGLAMHIKKRNLKCGECGEHFCNAHLLRRHVSGHLNIETVKCFVCNSSFITKYDLKRHKKVHSKSHDCLTCGKRFATKNYLKIHQHCHITKKGKVCHLCGEHFSNIKMLRSHKRSQHNGSYKCMDCDKVYKAQQTMLNHYRIYHLHKCNICGEQFKQTTDLMKHSKTHKKSYSCKLCDESYPKQSKLNAHMKFHSVQKRPFKCETCGKGFKDESNLTIHKTLHEGMKLFRCSVFNCMRQFSDNHSLQSHMKTHNRRHKREECDNKCMNRQPLKQHMVIHTGPPVPLECDVCGKQYTVWAALVRHKKMHMREKQFKCEICDKSFFRKDALEQHNTEHVVEKFAFKCEESNKEFL